MSFASRHIRESRDTHAILVYTLNLPYISSVIKRAILKAHFSIVTVLLQSSRPPPVLYQTIPTHMVTNLLSKILINQSNQSWIDWLVKGGWIMVSNSPSGVHSWRLHCQGTRRCAIVGLWTYVTSFSDVCYGWSRFNNRLFDNTMCIILDMAP